jgi:peptidoglycan/xylan/chitin deacetylase (PgdA/CDA1 family)
MKKILIPISFLVLVLAQSCGNNNTATNTKTSGDTASKTTTTANSAQADTGKTTGPVADAATILARKEIPILCYHHIKPEKPKSEYTVQADVFRAQLKALHDSGYHSILPDQLYAYLTRGASLPNKPFMLTYDDTDEEQFSIAKTEMDKYGFKGVYFIMTISIGRPRYMTKEQIKQLSDEGHVIGAHTWDHHMVTKYQGEDWVNQLDKPIKKEEDITGKPVTYFAYPFGLWNEAAIPEIKKRGLKMAFQLSTKRDPQEPLYTVRRIIIPTISPETLLRSMRNNFR